MISAEKGSSSHSKRILWINPIMLNDGLHKTDFLEILMALAKRGYNICLVAINPGSSKRKLFHDRDSKIRVISLPLRNAPVITQIMFATLLAFLLPIYIINFKPKFVIARPHLSVLSLMPAFFLSRPKNVEFILDIRSTPVETMGFRGFLQRFWFAPSILMAKRLFKGMTIISPLMRREVSSSFHLDSDKIGIWTSGVSTDLFNPQNCISESIELKRKLGLSGKFVVFYHGVFTATRGLTETLKAVKTLKRQNLEIVFFLLGTGPMTPILKGLIDKEGLQGNAIIHEPVDHREVPKFIGISNVCIIPLPNHPFWRFQSPLKLLEYLAMNKVVIATDIPAHRSIIDEEKCGIYIQSTKPVEIARSIVYAYNNKERLADWGRSGRKIIMKKYSWEKVAKDLEDYLSSIDTK